MALYAVRTSKVDLIVQRQEDCAVYLMVNLMVIREQLEHVRISIETHSTSFPARSAATPA